MRSRQHWGNSLISLYMCNVEAEKMTSGFPEVIFAKQINCIFVDVSILLAKCCCIFVNDAI